MCVNGEAKRVVGGDTVRPEQIPNFSSMIASGYIVERFPPDSGSEWKCSIGFDVMVDGVRTRYERGDIVPGSIPGLERLYRAGYIRQEDGCYWVCTREFSYADGVRKVVAKIGDIVLNAHLWPNRIALEKSGFLRCINGEYEAPVAPKSKRKTRSE